MTENYLKRLEEIRNSLSSASADATPADVYTSVESETSKLPDIDLEHDVDWEKFEVFGVKPAELLTKALNKMIEEEFGKHKISNIVFEVRTLLDRAGLGNIQEFYNALGDEIVDNPIILAEDKDGYNWKRYLLEHVFQKFVNAGWNVEYDFNLIHLDDPDVVSLINETYDDEVDRHNAFVLLRESALGFVNVTMSPDDDEEEGYDDPSVDEEDENHEDHEDHEDTEEPDCGTIHDCGCRYNPDPELGVDDLISLYNTIEGLQKPASRPGPGSEVKTEPKPDVKTEPKSLASSRIVEKAKEISIGDDGSIKTRNLTEDEKKQIKKAIEDFSDSTFTDFGIMY